MLEISGIGKSFGDQRVLNGFSYTFEDGGVFALMGANGSGKTTLFNLISGFLRPDYGHIKLGGQDVSSKSPDQIACLGLARTFQDLRIFPTLTVEDNLYISIPEKSDETILGAILHCGHRSRHNDTVSRLLEQTHLNDVRKQKAGEISFGQQKLLTLGMALATKFSVLLLDEPIAGIQPHFQELIASLLSELTGKTIIIIEHNVNFIDIVTRKILFLASGQIIAEGDYKSISSLPAVQEAYL